MSEEEALLIERCKEGDDEAFKKLVGKYTNLVGSIAYNILGDIHLAYDITQETFLKVYRNLDHLEDPARFKGWLCTIARTTCVDMLRKGKMKTVSLEHLAEEGIEPSGKPMGGTLKQVPTEVEELREKILNIINELPKIYQQIIMLRHLRKMTYKEISGFLNLPMATIESRLYRARLMLKDRMQDLYL